MTRRESVTAVSLLSCTFEGVCWRLTRDLCVCLSVCGLSHHLCVPFCVLRAFAGGLLCLGIDIGRAFLLSWERRKGHDYNTRGMNQFSTCQSVCKIMGWWSLDFEG